MPSAAVSTKKVLVASYPKSGNTWLGYMLAYYLGAKYIDLHIASHKTTQIKWILDLIDGNLPHSSEYSAVAKTHHLPKSVENITAYDKIVLVCRDPRDVMVSYFYFRYHYLPVEFEKPFFFHIGKLSPLKWLLWKHLVWKVATYWPVHTQSWMGLNPLVIRYEDLHGQPQATLEFVLKYLGIVSPDRNLINQVIDAFAFEKVSGGRKPGDEDTRHFYRKGIVGDHKNYFDKTDLQMFRIFSGEEMRKLKYLV